MRLNFPFRVARGVAVVLSIVIAHATIFWLFNTMQVRVPDLGPVFATLLVDPAPDSNVPPQDQAAAAPVLILPSAPPAQAPSRDDHRPQSGDSQRKRGE